MSTSETCLQSKLLISSTSQLLLKISNMPTCRAHQALKRSTLGRAGSSPPHPLQALKLLCSSSPCQANDSQEGRLQRLVAEGYVWQQWPGLQPTFHSQICEAAAWGENAQVCLQHLRILTLLNANCCPSFRFPRLGLTHLDPRSLVA